MNKKLLVMLVFLLGISENIAFAGQVTYNISFTYWNTSIIQNSTVNLTTQIITQNISVQNNATSQLLNLTVNISSPVNATLVRGEIFTIINLNGTTTNKNEWKGDWIFESYTSESQNLDNTTTANGTSFTRIFLNATNTLPLTFSSINISTNVTCRGGWTQNTTTINLSASSSITNYTIGCNATNLITLSNITALIFNQSFVTANYNISASFNISINNTDTLINYSTIVVNLTNYLRNNYLNMSRINFTIQLDPNATLNEQLNFSGARLVNVTSQETNIILARDSATTTRRCEIQFEDLTNDTETLEIRIPFSTTSCINLDGGTGKNVRVNKTTVTNTSKAYLNATLMSGFNVVVVTNSFGNSSLPSGTFLADIDYVTAEGVGGTSAGGGGGGGGGGAPQRACNDFDIFIPNTFRTTNTKLPIDVQSNIMNGSTKGFDLAVENLGTFDIIPDFQIIGLNASEKTVNLPLNPDWVTITKKWSTLSAGKTEGFIVSIKPINIQTGKTYEGKVIMSCNEFSDSVRIVVGTGTPSLLNPAKLNNPINLLGFSMSGFVIVLVVFAFGIGTSYFLNKKNINFKLPLVISGITAMALML